MTINTNLANVFEHMQQIVEDRQNGFRTTESVIVFDNRLYPLSVGYECSIELNDATLFSIDHALVYLRAVAFNDEAAASKIANAMTVSQALAIPIRRFTPNAWRRYERRSMQIAVGAKIAQNNSVRDTLKLTGVKRLVYASTTDKFFGCGLNINNDNAMYPQFWSGQNQLGQILEQYRKTI